MAVVRVKNEAGREKMPVGVDAWVIEAQFEVSPVSNAECECREVAYEAM